MQEEKYLKNVADEIEEKYELGVDKLDIGKHKEAEEIFKEILKENKEFVPVYNKLGILEIYKENLEKARDLFNQALEHDGEFAPAITNLGSLAKKRGNTDKAKELYEKAIRLDPDYGAAYNNLGVIYREEGNYSKSINYLKKAQKRGSFSVKINNDKSLFKEPGCIIPAIILVIAVISLVFWLT